MSQATRRPKQRQRSPSRKLTAPARHARSSTYMKPWFYTRKPRGQAGRGWYGGTGNGDKKRASASLPPSADRNASSVSNAWPGEGTQALVPAAVGDWGSFNTPKALSRSSGTTSPAFAAPRQNSSAISTRSDTACQGYNKREVVGAGSRRGANISRFDFGDCSVACCRGLPRCFASWTGIDATAPVQI